MQNYKIINVSYVIFCFQLMFYKIIKLIQINISKNAGTKIEKKIIFYKYVVKLSSNHFFKRF